jgi:CheY-like chemotaxis protein
VVPGDDRAQDLAGALHEVSNALTVVLGWLDVARSKLPSGPEREALEVARTHARLGYSIARQAIGAEVSDSVSGQGTMRATARTALTGVTPEAARRGVELILDGDHPGHALIGDVGAALQILTNLLLNAIAFTPRGSSVTLSLCDESSQAVFAVRDQGPGIPEDRVQSLFCGGPVSTRRGGAGVGLRHSHSLAQMHGGTLSVLPSQVASAPATRGSVSPVASNRSSCGACFELRWPIAEARSSTRPQKPVTASVRGARVLVVEDDAAVRSLIELALEARGAETELVGTASELERALLRGRFDLALVDLSPIADNAAAVLGRLRASNPGISIILISGIASGVPEEIERDVSAWVRKPFEMGEVIDVMGGLLAAQRVQAHAETAAG